MEIRELRRLYGLTQKQLADLTGIPKRSIENWEEGKSRPPAYLLRLLEFFLEHQ